jgi:multimeric flavodoxin WrbA
MHVLAINGSARANGNTASALARMQALVEGRSHTMSVVNLCEKRLNPCTACRACRGTKKCVQDDDINDIFQQMLAADAIVLASPVYFSNVTSRMAMLIERTGLMARGNGNALSWKIGASIAVARRAGVNVAYAIMNFFFGLAQMPIATSTYWNNVIAGAPGEAVGDQEGMQTIDDLATNLVVMMEKLRT